MTQVKMAKRMNACYRPHNLTEVAKYRYGCIVKYRKLRTKGFSEQEALAFLDVKRSTFFNWLSRFNKKCGNINMKTTELENKSRRPHNFRTSKIISPYLVSHILRIR